MKIAMLGGGGFRVPMVYGALLGRARLAVEEIALYDVDAERMARIAPVLAGLERERGIRLSFTTTTSLDVVLDGADYVFCAIRVGGLEGRVIDERVPVAEGVVGQETTGPGGICFALRTVPEMMRIAEAVAARAPGAWFVNFTNPAGLVTEAIQPVLGRRAIGVCDSATGLCRRVAAALGRRPDELWFDYFGLNHLGWLRGVYDGDRDLLPALLADDDRLASFDEGRLFGVERLRTLGMIPNEYLVFYDHAADVVAALRSGRESRAEFLLRQQHAFYRSNAVAPGDALAPRDALAAWRATRDEREAAYFAEARAAAGLSATGRAADDAGGYEGEAMAVVEAIVHDDRRVLILDTANRSALPFLDERAVVEVPAVVGRMGAVPLAVGDVPAHARVLLQTVKEVERLAIRAAVERSRRLAVEALAMHPLVASPRAAGRIFEAYAAAHPELADMR